MSEEEDLEANPCQLPCWTVSNFYAYMYVYAAEKRVLGRDGHEWKIAMMIDC